MKKITDLRYTELFTMILDKAINNDIYNYDIFIEVGQEEHYKKQNIEILNVHISGVRLGWILMNINNAMISSDQIMFLIKKTKEKLIYCEKLYIKYNEEKFILRVNDCERIISILKNHPNYPIIDRCIDLLE